MLLCIHTAKLIKGNNLCVERSNWIKHRKIDPPRYRMLSKMEMQFAAAEKYHENIIWKNRQRQNNNPLPILSVGDNNINNGSFDIWLRYICMV